MEKLNVLVISPHPDDTEIGCGGTIAKYAAQGHKVYIAVATNGNAGHVSIAPDELAKIRQEEARASAAVIGAELIWMGFDDEFLINDRETRIAFIELIRQCKADIILTTAPNDYHPDHRMLSEIVSDASFTASLPLVRTKSEAVTKVPPIFNYDTVLGIDFLPEEYVDISEHMDKKLEMISQHRSQLGFMLNYYGMDMVEHYKVISRFRGLQAGVEYAEGFRVVRGYPRVTTRRLLP